MSRKNQKFDMLLWVQSYTRTILELFQCETKSV